MRRFRLKTIDSNRILPILFSIGAAVLSVLLSLFIARPLGEERYGFITYDLGVINLLQVVLTFGMTFLLTKSTQFEQDKKRFFTMHLLLFLLICSVVLPATFIICFFFLKHFARDVLHIIVVLIAGASISLDSLCAAFLLGAGKASLSTLVGSFLPRLALFGGTVCFLCLGHLDSLPTFYVYVYAGAYLLSALPILILGVTLKSPKLPNTKHHYALLLSFFLLSATNVLNAQLAKIIQGEYDLRLGNSSLTGVLGLSLQIISFATLFGTVITSIAQPLFARRAEEPGHHGLIDSYRTVLRVNSAICIPFCIALCCEVKPLLSFFGESYSGELSCIVFVLLGCASLFSSLTGPSGTMLTYSNHEKSQIINGLVNVAVFVATSLGLLHVTPLGIAIGYLTAEVVTNILKLIEIRIFFRTTPIDWKTILYLGVMSVVSVAVFVPIGLFVRNRALWFAVNIAVGLGLIAAFVFLSPFKKDKLFFRKETIEEQRPNGLDNNPLSEENADQ